MNLELGMKIEGWPPENMEITYLVQVFSLWEENKKNGVLLDGSNTWVTDGFTMKNI